MLLSAVSVNLRSGVQSVAPNAGQEKASRSDCLSLRFRPFQARTQKVQVSSLSTQEKEGSDLKKVCHTKTRKNQKSH